jgi:hypothetical protein
MVLINLGFHAKSEARFKAMAQEHWRPSLQWTCLEYLCQSFTVVEERAWPDLPLRSGAALCYRSDLAMASSSYRRMPNGG